MIDIHSHIEKRKWRISAGKTSSRYGSLSDTKTSNFRFTGRWYTGRNTTDCGSSKKPILRV